MFDDSPCTLLYLQLKTVPSIFTSLQCNVNPAGHRDNLWAGYLQLQRGLITSWQQKDGAAFLFFLFSLVLSLSHQVPDANISWDLEMCKCVTTHKSCGVINCGKYGIKHLQTWPQCGHVFGGARSPVIAQMTQAFTAENHFLSSFFFTLIQDSSYMIILGSRDMLLIILTLTRIKGHAIILLMAKIVCHTVRCSLWHKNTINPAFSAKSGSCPSFSKQIISNEDEIGRDGDKQYSKQSRK